MAKKGNRNKAYGTKRENDARDLLIDEDYVVVRSAGSLGEADLVAMRGRTLGVGVVMFTDVHLIEVKANVDGGPYHDFGPGDRAELLNLAEKIGAEAWLYWWPHSRGGKLKRIHSSDWPGA